MRDRRRAPDASDAIERAFDWFREVEATLHRFDPESELMRLIARSRRARAGERDAVRGGALRARGRGGNRRRIRSDGRPSHGSARLRPRASDAADRPHAARRDERSPIATSTLDADEQTITLRRPLVLDLGAVAKGLAIDMAARELAAVRRISRSTPAAICISAATNAAGEPWSVGIRHPRDDDELIETLRVSDAAVCTSGDYERPDDARPPHLLDPRTGASRRRRRERHRRRAIGDGRRRARDRGVRARPARGHRACSSAMASKG